MRLTLLPLAAMASIGGVSPALAQNADWTGFYVGGRLGYSGQSDDSDETILFDTDLNGSFDDVVRTASGADAFARGFCGGGAGCRDENGTEWAVHAGYDLQMGGFFVVGLVAEYGRSEIEDSVSAFSGTPALYTFTRRLRGNGSLRARAGVAFGNTLAYATGGFAYGKIRREFTTSNKVNTFTTEGDDDKSYGYRVGAGIEQRISSRFSIGAQYLYTSLEDEDFRVRAGGANVPVSNPFILRNAGGTDFRRSGNRFNSSNISVVASLRF